MIIINNNVLQTETTYYIELCKLLEELTSNILYNMEILQ